MNELSDPTGVELGRLLGTERPARSHGHWRRAGWIALLVVLAGGFAVWATHEGGDAVQYLTQPAHRGSLTVTVTATGNIAPTNQVEVGSEVSGTVAKVNVDFNDRVRVGEVLAELDTSKLQAQVLQSRATLAAAKAKVQQTQATVTEATNELTRLQDVRKRSPNLVSQHDFDAARATLDRARADEASARASVEEAKAGLEINETSLSKAVIRSPVDGIVLNRSIEPGQTVAASLQAPVLFTVAEDLARMELDVAVDEADVGQVREGQPATFTVDAFPDRQFAARVEQVRYGPETVDGVVTYQTVLSVDNSDLALRPGMTATADIVVATVSDALLVPNAALRFTPPVAPARESSGGILQVLLPHHPPRLPRGGTSNGSSKGPRHQQVWMLRDGAPVAVAVKTGATDGASTQILEGDLSPGTPVVVDSVSKVKAP